MIYEHLKNITFYIYIYIYKVLHITLDRQFLIKLKDRELFAGHSFASLHKATKTFFSCVFFFFHCAVPPVEFLLQSKTVRYHRPPSRVCSLLGLSTVLVTDWLRNHLFSLHPLSLSSFPTPTYSFCFSWTQKSTFFQVSFSLNPTTLSCCFTFS